jgi:hypothetical protein
MEVEFMKKKLVSILLSLSMCASFGAPLTAAAEETAPAEPEVVETQAPNATGMKKEVLAEVKSGNSVLVQILRGGITNTSINVEYGSAGYTITKYDHTSGTLNDNNINNVNFVISGAAANIKKQGWSTDQTNAKEKKKAFNFSNGKITPVKANAGTATYTVVGKNDVEASVDFNITVDPMNIASRTNAALFDVSGKDDKKYKDLATFMKKTKISNYTVKWNGKALTNKTDYTAEMKPGNKTAEDADGIYVVSKAGVASSTNGAIVSQGWIRITGKGNYTGELTISKTAIKANLYPQRISYDVYDDDGEMISYGSEKHPIGLMYGYNEIKYTDETGKIKVPYNIFRYIGAIDTLSGDALNDESAMQSKHADIVKMFKYKTSKKTLKVNAKTGEITIKKASTEPQTIEMICKKNANCKKTFYVLPSEYYFEGDSEDYDEDSDFGAKMNLANNFAVDANKDILQPDLTKISNKKNDAKKTFKSIEDFTTKLGKGKAGFALKFKAATAAKAKKLKVGENKDYKVEVNVASGTGITSSGGVYFDNQGKVFKNVDVTIKGVGNYTGSAIIRNIPLKLETQQVTATAVNVVSSKGIEYADGGSYNIFDFIKVDGSTIDKKKEADIKAAKLKFKTSKNLKVNGKTGDITVKGAGDGTVKITPTKNKDAAYELAFPVKAKEINQSTVTVTLPSKTSDFKNSAAVVNAYKKAKVVDKKTNKTLKKKDVTVSASFELDANSETKGKVTVEISAGSSGNYKDGASGSYTLSPKSVSLKEKKK